MYQNYPPCMNPDYNRHFYNIPENFETVQLARAYMPIQPYEGLLPLNVALKKGTVFPNIDVTYPRI